MARRHNVPLTDAAIHLLLVLLFLVGAPRVSLAWGEVGHSTVAEIADHYLSAAAKAEVRELLGPGEHQMAAVANWADEVRDSDRPETYNWHQVEMPPDGVRYDRARDCSNDDCIVEKLKTFAQMVGDRQLAKAARTETLKFLIHFVGDIHVPLHALVPLSRRKGTWVRIGGNTEKLHCLWDYAWCDARFEADFGSLPDEIARNLVSQITGDQLRAWSAGTAEDWANESFAIAHDFITRHEIVAALARGDNSQQTPIILPDSTLDEIRPIITQRLKMAGLRLAWLLNEAFK